MCGRYTLHMTRLEALADLVGLERSLIIDKLALDGWAPRFNVAPSQSVPVITRTRDDKNARLGLRQWGFLPAWATDAQVKRQINARVETVARLPMFREAFAQRRCIVPATGYFEWQSVGERKQPQWIHPLDGTVMSLAGICERWVSRDGEVIDSFAIVTMPASPELSRIHDRMPLELHGADLERWLAQGPLEPEELAAIAELSAVTDHLTHHPVTPAMGSPKLDDPSCIEPQRSLADALAQLSLFDLGELNSD